MGLSLLRRYCIALGLSVAAAGLCAAATPAPKAGAARLLVLGDSLSAEYGLQRGSGWVALLQQRLAQQQRAVQVINASISGDTSSGGRTRLPALLAQHQPTLVIIELGANDALRGLPLDLTRTNLAAMTQAAQASGAKVLLLGMQMPPNYGAAYASEFAAMFAAVARSHQAALVPFLLKGVADVAHAETLFQSDRIHPTEAAHPIILDNVWPSLKKLLG
ncbi:MAG: arylesterase [Rhodoferax sp.]